jgi:hypothetical protein
MNKFRLPQLSDLLSLSDLRLRYPAMITDEEALVISRSSGRVLPILYMEQPPSRDEQVRFVKALAGEIESQSLSQLAWRKYLLLQQAAAAQQVLTRCQEGMFADTQKLQGEISQMSEALLRANGELQSKEATLRRLRFKLEELATNLDVSERDSRRQIDQLYRLDIEIDRQEKLLRHVMRVLDEILPGYSTNDSTYISMRTEGLRGRLPKLSKVDLDFLIAIDWRGFSREEIVEIHNRLFENGGDANVVAVLRSTVERLTPARPPVVGFSSFVVYANTDGQ